MNLRTTAIVLCLCFTGCVVPGMPSMMSPLESRQATLAARIESNEEKRMPIGTTAEFSRTIYIDAAPQQVWSITGEDFANIDKWISGVNASIGSGQGVNGSLCTERTCVPSYRGFKDTTERLVEFDPAARRLKYQIVEGLPGMVEYATNEWTHEAKGEGTQVTMRIKMRLNGVMGFAMKPMLGVQMGKILGEGLEELKVYAETGELHPRKAAAKRKYEKKQRRL
ncbi:MAG: SRPBCC family protein [Planctomycetota bacterium]